jgi:hypothetical protein
MKSETIFVALGIGAVGYLAWRYLKDKPVPIAERMEELHVAPLPKNFPIVKDTAPRNLPSDLLTQTSGNSGIVPPLATPSISKPVAIPSIGPRSIIDTIKLKRPLSIAGLNGLSSAYLYN